MVDEHFNIIDVPDQISEILLGGPGLTLGYIGRPKENEEQSVVLDVIRYYRTGDMAKWRRNDPKVLKFFGRYDLQVKHGGFRVELEEIKQSLLSTAQLPGAIMVQVPLKDSNHDPLLAASVIPFIANRMRVRDIITYTQDRLPKYMVPQDMIFCSKFPLTKRGKMDRKALIQGYIKQREEKEKAR